jgi:hypothetical protein
MFRDPGRRIPGVHRSKSPTENCWDNYTEEAGLTICVEGTNGSMGSHGVLHKETAELLFGEIEKEQDITKRNYRSMKYTTARDLLAKLVGTLYGCNKHCISAQLDKAYKPMYKCQNGLKNAKVVGHSGTAGDTKQALTNITRTRRTF